MRTSNKLTEVEIRQAKPKEKPQKLFDGGGLFLLLDPSGGKWWRLKYRFGGSEKLISLGTYPQVSLKEARTRREEAKKKLEAGIDPAAQKKAIIESERADTANAFEAVAREWFGKNEATWSASHKENTIARLEKDIFPPLGRTPIYDIEAPALLNALRQIEARGAIETAHRVLTLCGQVFRYAIATGRAKRDVTQDLRGALEKRQGTNFAALTDPKRIGELLRDIDAYQGSLSVRYALQLAPYVFVRPSELRLAEWTEFDFDTQEWRIPAHKMKMRQEHIVPLAGQVIRLLRELAQYTGDGKYLFPSERERVRAISDMALLSAVRRLGYSKDELTIHGFRATASTLLNEQGFEPDVIERQLAHGEKNKVRAAYNRAAYLPERRRMMQVWADFLDSLKNTTA